MEIHNILIPVDFSPASKFAVDCGVSLAGKFHAKLTLMHVIEKHSSHLPAEKDQTEEQRQDQGLRLLSALLCPEDQNGLGCQFRIRHGNVENEIRLSVHDEKADIVIIGTHSQGPVRKMLIGSVAQDLLRKLPVPLITVSLDTHPLKFTRILYATDLTGSFQDGFIFLLDVARHTSAELVVFHCIEAVGIGYGGMIPVIEPGDEKEHFIEEVRKKLADIEAEGIRAGIKIRTELAEGSAAEKILAAVDDLSADLVAMTIQEKGVVERLVLGSTAERVVRDSKVPVLSVPVHVKKHSDDNMEGQTVPDRSAHTENNA